MIMKNIIAFVLSAVIFLGVFPCASASAEAQCDEPQIIYFDDGCYAVISVENGHATRSVKTGSKTYSFYDDTGALKWTASLTATFFYNGSTSSCTSANCNVTINDSHWYVISNSSSYSGNTATANVTMGRKLLGVTVRTIPITMTLSCDANGHLS